MSDGDGGTPKSDGDGVDATTKLGAALMVLRALEAELPDIDDVIEAMDLVPEIGENLVRLARSPVVGITAEDLSVQRAIVLVGFSTVRSMTVVTAARELASGDFGPEYWDRALLTGIATQQLAVRAGVKANDGLIAGMLNRWVVDTGSSVGERMVKSLPEDVIEAVQVRDVAWIDASAPILCRLVAAGRPVADLMADRLPGIPSTVALTDLLETTPCPGLADARLATDILRGIDMFQALHD